MEMKKLITFLVVLIIIVSIMIVFKTVEKINKEYANQREAEFFKSDDEQGLPQTKPEDSEKSEESRGSLEGSGGAGVETEIGNRTLPSDLYTRPCSFYFSEYGVCAGTCPSGTCTQEGQSCYCRET